jgi:DNA replication protein DnaC
MDLDFYHRPLDPEPSFRVTREMLINAGIGRNYWNCSIDKIPDQCDYKKTLRRIVNELPASTRAGKGVIFWGNHGYGKTSAADIVLKAALARGGQCYHRLAGTIEHTYSKRWVETNLDGIEIWDVLTKSQILVIDDLGSEMAAAGYKAGDTRMIEELIRMRYDNRLPTYITTNLPMPELMKGYQPVASIFLEPSRFEFVEVTGHNWRNPRER